ncbi:YrhA family protein [Enterococcus sp. BWR-S5]|uniref:YrhA family protein n=1 Tax=Enterococcus sp. BWR-S5 TaxID=2787714 RepID=UPI001922CCE5|nr:YrhA family protein [Enterococcus sp. BWR-S5]MBL1227062.1 SMI1/KNR4 family protein [Enterococcus sp. BWR-S5]
MITEKIEALNREAQQFNEELNKGISDDEIRVFNLQANMKLKFSFPEEYTNSLKVINGFDFNGCVLYGIDEEYLITPPNQTDIGAIDNNLVWQELNEPNYIFLGDENMSWFVYDRISMSFRMLDKPSATKLEEYLTFEELFEKILDMALN